jgi:hypothetical protein
MKKQILFFLFAIPLITFSQEVRNDFNFKSNLHLSQHLDTISQVNRQIIETLDNFLISRDSALFKNDYWVKSDFEKYKFPYLDLFGIEHEGDNRDIYNPDLLKIIEIERDSVYLLKIAFVGSDCLKGQSFLKSVYTLLALVEDNKVLFSRALNHYLKSWKKLNHYPITYFISPNKEPNQKEIENQLSDIDYLNNFFETDSIEITYYSCVNPKELFEMKGFDYSAGMYQHPKGGIVEFGNHVFSGNNSECYTHEITHIYVNSLFPETDQLLNEGIATLIGGSGGLDYNWHKESLRNFVLNREFSFLDYLAPYNYTYANEKTPLPYMTGALICEYIIENYGKEILFRMFREKKPLWDGLKDVGLNKENFDNKLLKQLKKH